VVLALVGTVAIIGYVDGAESRAQAGEHIVQVLVVKDSVPAGTPAKELGDRVGLEKISAKVKADGAVTDVQSLGNKVTGTTLVPGEQLIAERFVAKSSFSATGANVQVPPGLLRTTLALDPQRVIGGVLTPGATVTVAASFEKDESQPAVTGLLAQKVLVTNVQLTGTVNSNDNTSEEKTATTAKPGQAPTNQLLVTLALDPTATARLVFAQEFGHLWISIQPTDAPDAALPTVTRASVLR
jgi:pilus assembly protein CpaB